MKNRVGTGIVLVVFASLMAFTATGLAQGTSGKVEIKSDFILVHPGTKLSKPDSQALDDVLKQYDKSLYKVETYKNGRVTNSLGTLKDMCIDQTAVAELAQAKMSGQSERAVQMIAPSTGAQEGTAVNPVLGGQAVNPVSGGQAVNPQTGSPTPGTAVNPVTGSPSPVNPQTSGSASNPQCATPSTQTTEFLQRLRPI